MSLYQLIVKKGMSPCGMFVIDAPVSQSEVLSSLTEEDKGRICHLVQATSVYRPGIPPGIVFQFWSALANPLDYSGKPPTFTTENGYPVWLRLWED